MISVSIIGAGRVAFHLVQALKNKPGINLLQIYSRSGFSNDYIQNFPKSLSLQVDINSIQETDLFIIAVKDDAIKEVSEKIPFRDKLVIHTSGSTEMDILGNHNRKGVLYPIQSFSLDKKIDWKNVPICWETEYQKDKATLQKIAGTISEKVYHLDSHQRKKLHIACVFANNFTNHIIYQSQEICKQYDIPTELIDPLIYETFEKLKNISPYDAQTGPAIRNDQKTIAAQTDSLSGIQKEIYQILTKSILQSYGRKEL